MKLEKYFRTPLEDFEDRKICFERNQKHWDEIYENFPDLDIVCHLMLDDLGKTYIRAFVYCPENITATQTRTIIKWMNRYFGKAERSFREKEGTFYWTSEKKYQDENGEYTFRFLLEKTHPLTCVVKKVKKEVEVFESVCK